MDAAAAKKIVDKVIGQVFGYQNPYSLEEFMERYTFDIRLPIQVNDSTTDEPTWAQSMNPIKFITMDNAGKQEDWMQPKQPLASRQDVLRAWNEINYTATERQIDSLDIAESDNIYFSEGVYRSQDIHRSKHIAFSDGVLDSEYVVASQRSNGLAFSARVEDSKEVSNSFAISWSGKVSNSMFVHNCFDMFECLFCSHVSAKKFCIANMQFEEAEYRKLKEEIVQWVLTG